MVVSLYQLKIDSNVLDGLLEYISKVCLVSQKLHKNVLFSVFRTTAVDCLH